MDNKKNPGHVPLTLCSQKHEALAKEISVLSTEISMIKNALIGKDMKSGLVKDILDIKNKVKGTWSGKDKALVAIAIIEGTAALVVALISCYK